MAMEIHIPLEFSHQMQKAFGDPGTIWLDTLPLTIKKFLMRCTLIPDGNFENLRFSHVLPVRMRD